MAELIYDCEECMKLIKETFPCIPMGVIRRVLYAEEKYMKKAGIIDYEPKLNDWKFKD